MRIRRVTIYLNPIAVTKGEEDRHHFNILRYVIIKVDNWGPFVWLLTIVMLQLRLSLYLGTSRTSLIFCYVLGNTELFFW